MAAALFLISDDYDIWASDALVESDTEGSSDENTDGKDIALLQGREHLLQEMDKLCQERHQELTDEVYDTYSEESTEEIQYFQYQKFHDNLGISKNDLRVGQEWLRSNDIHFIDVSTFYSDYEGKGIEKLYGSSRLYTDSYYPTEILYDKSGIVSASCGEFECRWEQKGSSKSRIGYVPCKHLIGLILLTERYLERNNPGDDTNADGMRLLSELKNGDQQVITEDMKPGEESIRVEPHVKLRRGYYPVISFRVGASKLYKLKKLSELIEKSENHEEMRFGKNTMIEMGEEYYDETSIAWYHFIRMVVEEEQHNRERYAARSRSYYYSDYIPELKDEIPLYGNYLDLFYDAMGEQPVSFEYTDGRHEKRELYLTAGEGRLETELTISKYEDEKTHQFLGVQMTGEVPEMIEGQKYSYYLDEEHICRVDGEMARRLEPVTGIAKDGRVNAIIGRKHLSDFYYKTLPYLRQFMTITEQDQDVIDRYLPPKPEFICYFDLDEDMILCRAEAIYGSKVHSLYDSMESLMNYESYRDVDAESELMRCLLKYVSHYDESIPILYADRDTDTIYELMSAGFPELMNLSEVRVTERFKKLKLRNNFKVNIGVSVTGSNLMDLSIHSEDLSDEELLEVLSSYRAKKRYYRLKNGDFVNFEDNDTVEQLNDMMETMQIPLKQFVSGKMQLPAYRALYMDKMLEQTEGVYAERDQKFKRLIKEFKAVEDADYEIPVSLKKVLRKYQKIGYQWLRTLDQYGFGGILADEMGLGKTLQVITVLLADKQENQEEHHTSLIVCPASLVYNWDEEIRRFAPELRHQLVVGTKTERERIIEKCETADVIVTSYDLLKRDIDCYEGKQFRFEIIDEAQTIKNQNTAAAKAVKLIKSATKFALTGTPIENRLSELWSIFDYLMPGFLYDYQSFKKNIETPVVKNENEEVRNQLRRMVSPFILRRRKQEVLKDLPDKLEEVRYAGMSSKQRKLYDGQVVKLQKLLKKQSDEDYNKNRIQVLAELTRIRQICCDPSLIYEDYNGESAKRESLMELIDGVVEGDHKALIFSQFTSMFDIIEKDLNERGISYYKITGSTPKEKRVELVNAFNQNDVPIFLISLKAGGTGLNLTGADIVVHYDPWWNVAAQNQATDRAHRIGQTKVVTVYRLILKDTIEEKIVEMQEAKQKLAEDILGGEAVSSAQISREELLELLK